MRGPKSYVELLDEVLLKKDALRGNDNPLRPSNAGTCSRRIAYEFAAYLGLIEPQREERKPSVLRLLNLGHFIETQVVDDCKEIEGFKVKYAQQEVDIFTLPFGTEVTGHTDLVLYSEEHRGVSDVKSMGDRWEAAFQSKWDKLLYTYKACSVEFSENSFWVEDLEQFLDAIGTEDSLYKNLIQLNLYACCDFLKKRGVDHGSIIRYNKNNSKLMEIRFAPSQSLFDKTQSRFAAIEAVYEHEDVKLVPKERMLGSVDCAYCPYKGECWPKASKQEIYANAPKKNWAARASELPAGIEELLSEFQAEDLACERLAKLETKIILALENAGVSKVKTSDGAVFEVKHLKSGSVLRKGKE